MDDLHPTKIAIIGGTLLIIFIAIGIFMGAIPTPGRDTSTATTSETSIWLPESLDFLERIAVQDFRETNDKIQTAVTIIPDAEYETRLLNALAAGTGPELWLLSQNKILEHREKTAKISFTRIPERTYLDTFIDEAALFLVDPDSEAKNSGYIIAVPILIDPLILYWNKDLSSGAGIARAPATWDEFIVVVKQLTIRDAAGNFIQSGTALGEFGNVSHAKDFISLLILQTGNPIVERNTLAVTLDRHSGALTPAISAIRFWNEFSNPRKDSYSWNHLRPNDLDAFAAGRLAIYFGYPSERDAIIKKNPHLNFDVAEVPQIVGGTTRATYGRLTAVAISKSAADSSAAFALLNYLAGADIQKKIADTLERPSVRRDILSATGQNARLTVYSRAAVKSRGWLDPSSVATYDIIKKMVEAVKSGAKEANAAVNDAKNELQNLIRPFI